MIRAWISSRIGEMRFCAIERRINREFSKTHWSNSGKFWMTFCQQDDHGWLRLTHTDCNMWAVKWSKPWLIIICSRMASLKDCITKISMLSICLPFQVDLIGYSRYGMRWMSWKWLPSHPNWSTVGKYVRMFVVSMKETETPIVPKSEGDFSPEDRTDLCSHRSHFFQSAKFLKRWWYRNQQFIANWRRTWDGNCGVLGGHSQSDWVWKNKQVQRTTELLELIQSIRHQRW
jgi:hypothetical protein